MAEFFKIYFSQKINLNLAKCRCRWNENAREIHSLWLYSNRRNLIFTNLTFLFIGHWEQTMNFHCLKKIEWVATLLPSVIRSSYCFEMVARIMWLYKTSNIAQVPTSFKFFLNRIGAQYVRMVSIIQSKWLAMLLLKPYRNTPVPVFGFDCTGAHKLQTVLKYLYDRGYSSL